jgi:hypothetical protein
VNFRSGQAIEVYASSAFENYRCVGWHNWKTWVGARNNHVVSIKGVVKHDEKGCRNQQCRRERQWTDYLERVVFHHTSTTVELT